jgi:hypothetical protein
MRGAIQAVANFISASIKLIGRPAPKPCAPSDFGISAIATSSHFAGHCWYMMKRFTKWPGPLESEGTTREKTHSSSVLINEHGVGPQRT